MRRIPSITAAALLIAASATVAEPPARESFEITGHQGPVAFIGFSADSKVLTTVDDAGLVRRWDARTGELLSSRTDPPLPLEYPLLGAGGRLPGPGFEMFFPTRSFAADGSGVARVAKAGTVRIRDLTTGKEREIHPDDGLEFSGVVFSWDGKMLATAATRGRIEPKLAQLRFWDAATGKLLRTADPPKRVRFFGKIGEPDPPVQMAFAPDGKTLVTAAAEVRFWDVATGRERAGGSFYSGSGFPWTVSFSPDGKAVAFGVMMGGLAGSLSCTQVFDTATGKQRAFLSWREEAGPGLFLPGGRAIATQKQEEGPSSEESVLLWDARTWEKTVRLDGLFVASSPDGQTVLTLASEDDRKSRVLTSWDAVTGARLRRLPGHGLSPLPGARPSVSAMYSPDGRRLAVIEARGGETDDPRKIDPAEIVVRVVPTAGAPWKEATPPAIAPPPRLVVPPVVLALPREVRSEAYSLLSVMDSKIAAARTLRIEVVTDSREDGRLQETLLIASGNRYRREAKRSNSTYSEKFYVVCDGQQTYGTLDHPGVAGRDPEGAAFSRMPVPDWEADVLRRRHSRGPTPGEAIDETEPKDGGRTSNAKLLPDEEVNGVRARVVEYDLSRPGSTATVRVRVWIDARTGLPLRRVVGDALTETYTKFEIDPKLDDKLFELPK